MSYKKKLIEVALPLKAINTEAAKEKSIPPGHPSKLHLYWARRPLAAARAVIWASLVDDPSSLPEQFPTEEEQNKERERLFEILSRLVKWENSNNKEVLNEAKAEIMRSTNGNPPPLLDPFAGGGSIPLEAQRLGLEAHASDLNPVAVMINKAMIEIPPKFADQPPINPQAQAKPLKTTWTGAQGLAEDVRYYGECMKKKAFEKIGHLYPKVRNKDGEEHTVIAYIWARTVKCPNPACCCEMPLVKSFHISQKSGKEVWVKPIINGRKVLFEVQFGKGVIPECTVDQKINGARCVKCGQPVGFDYLRGEAKLGRMSITLMAVCAENIKGKVYLSPDEVQVMASNIEKPDNSPSAMLPERALGFRVQQYGMQDFSELYTSRQLIMLTQFCNLIEDIEIQIQADGGSIQYSEAVVTYLQFTVDRMANYGSSLCLWDTRGGTAVQTFGRQALSMIWNFAESNPFSNAGLVGSWSNAISVIANAIENLPATINSVGLVNQSDAKVININSQPMISTDPPYYDNIGYADLSDFFYMWLRQNMKKYYSDVFRTLLVPKEDELIANPFRFGNEKDKAKRYFENGMHMTFQRLKDCACDYIPVTIYYAFKQSESDDEYNTSSTGWETMLQALINANFIIIGTWPIRTENSGGLRVNNRNALASSIVLVCRKRPVDAPKLTRRDFINTLKRELKPALQKLQSCNIAPVDLAQSAIGPGMGVYSQYSEILEADGTPMSVRTALQIINQELDHYFDEQDGELDSDSRFCVELYTQYAFDDMKFGEADVLARAKNTSVEKLAGNKILCAQKGIVRLLTREKLPKEVNGKIIWLLTQQLTHAMDPEKGGGVVAAANIVTDFLTSEPEQAKALAYRLHTIAERKGWTQEAYAYNSLVTAWPEVQAKVAQLQSQRKNSKQMKLFNDTNN